MTREHWLGLAIACITIVATLCLLAILDEAEPKVQVDCMDPTEREKIRDIVLKGIDSGLEKSILGLFDIWTKDPTEQPKRAMVGTNNAVNAHVRARKQALAWEPPACPKD